MTPPPLPTAVATRFRQVESQLDAALREALPVITDFGCAVREESNRSGIEKSGWPYYVWSYCFQFDELLEGQIWRAQATASYRDLGDERREQTLDLQWTAEIFSPGAASDFIRKGVSQYPLREIEGERLAEIVEAGLKSAKAVLRAHRRGRSG
jgi:hypothetical protein